MRLSSGVRSAAGWLVPAAGILAALIVMFLRRPDILLDAKLWAEDGTIWYAEAQRSGALSALLRPQNGYFQTISRLVFGASLALPLEHVPLFANAVGLLIRAALVGFLLSGRFDWVPWSARLALATYYLLMPGIGEVHANITNAHWYLALYALMVVLAAPARSRAGRLHDYAVLAIAGLSGPFILLLLPCLIVRVLCDAQHRGPAIRLLVFAVLLAAVQLAAIVTTGADTRAPAPLGATPGLVVKILASRVVAEAFLPVGPRDLGTNAIIFVAAAAVIAMAIRAGGWRALCVLLLAVLQMGAAMASPMISLHEPQWPLFMISGERYFMLPRLAFVTLILFALSQLRVAWWAKAALGLGMVLALQSGFRIRPVEGPAFATEVSRYRAAAPGEAVVLQISPPSWSMTLIRR